MKKIITTFLAIALILCLLCTLAACQEYRSIHEEDYKIGYCEELNDAFLGTFYWRGHLGEDMNIFLPNSYNGTPITALGGYIGIGYPLGFEINFWEKSNLREELFGGALFSSLTGSLMDVNTAEQITTELSLNLEAHNITKEVAIEDIVFNLYIGSNLKEIECIDGRTVKYLYYVADDENEVLTVYAFSFVITVDEQNEYFYSDELGRMYHKESGELVSEFLYYNRDTFPEGSLSRE